MAEEINDRVLQHEQQMLEGMLYVEKFVSKSYLINSDRYEIAAADTDIHSFNGVRMIRIDKLVYEENENVNYLLASVYSALHSLSSVSTFLLVDSRYDSVTLYLGISSKKDSAVASEVLEKSMRGNFPGTHFEPLDGQTIRSVLGNLTINRCSRSRSVKPSIASVAVVPTLRGEGEEDFVQGLEKLLEAMKGEEYTAIMISEPVSQTEVETRKSGFEAMYTSLLPFQKTTISYGENTSSTVSKSISEGFSNSVSKSVTMSNTEGKSDTSGTSDSTTFGTSSNINDSVSGSSGDVNWSRGGGFGTNSSTGSSSSFSFSTSTSFSRSIATSTGNALTITDTVGNSDSKGSSSNLTLNYENKKVTDLLEHIEDHLARLKENEVYGWWLSGAYFISSSVQTAVVAASNYKALMTGDVSQVENAFINVWDGGIKGMTVSRMLRSLSIGRHPVFNVPRTGSFNAQNIKTAHLISGKEIPIFSGFPRTSVLGLVVDKMATFGRQALLISGNKAKNDFQIGSVVHKGEIDPHNRIGLSLEAFRSHCFVTGSTGSGKSNTVYCLLNNLIRHNIKFLIIEPAKGEYKFEYGNLKEEGKEYGVKIYWTNPNTYPLLRINPFSFPKEIHILEHLDRLMDVFNSCWALEKALPGVLKQSIEAAYVNKGWDLVRSVYIGDSETPVFPTIKDVKDAIAQNVKDSKYSSDNKGDIEAALNTRLTTLSTGIMGQVLCSGLELSMEKLFDENTVIDLSRVGAAETKSLLMGILVIKLNEYRSAKAEGENVPLKHVTVLEEAHNLLRNTRGKSDGSSGGDMIGKSVEMISNSIAEMRTYGEGFIIVDQSPTAVDISAIKNTNTKIVMRLPEQNDQEVVGHSFSLTPEQIKEISRLDVGMAVLAQNGWTAPVLAKIDSIDHPYYGRENPGWTEEKLKEAVGFVVADLLAQYENICKPETEQEQYIEFSLLFGFAGLTGRKADEYRMKIHNFCEATVVKKTDMNWIDTYVFIRDLIGINGLNLKKHFHLLLYSEDIELERMKQYVAQTMKDYCNTWNRVIQSYISFGSVEPDKAKIILPTLSRWCLLHYHENSKNKHPKFIGLCLEFLKEKYK